MIIRLREILRRTGRDQLGALSAEYVAVLIVIGLIVAALVNADIAGEVESCGETAVGEVFNTSSDDNNPC